MEGRVKRGEHIKSLPFLLSAAAAKEITFSAKILYFK